MPFHGIYGSSNLPRVAKLLNFLNLPTSLKTNKTLISGNLPSLRPFVEVVVCNLQNKFHPHLQIHNTESVLEIPL